VNFSHKPHPLSCDSSTGQIKLQAGTECNSCDAKRYHQQHTPRHRAGVCYTHVSATSAKDDERGMSLAIGSWGPAALCVLKNICAELNISFTVSIYIYIILLKIFIYTNDLDLPMMLFW